MYDMNSGFFAWEMDRIQKTIGLPADDVTAILNQHIAKLHKDELDKIVSECDSKEEAVRRLVLVDFMRDYIRKNLQVTDEFINHSLYDHDDRYEEISSKIYKKLKDKADKTTGESEYCIKYEEERRRNKEYQMDMIGRLYATGASREKIYAICDALDISREEADHLMETAKQEPNTIEDQ